MPAELLRVRDRPSKNSRSEQRHRGPDPYKACNTKPQNASLSIHIANIDPSYCNTFSLSLFPPSLSAIISCCYHLIICNQSLCTHVHLFSPWPFVLLETGNNKLASAPVFVSLWYGAILLAASHSCFGLKEHKQQVLPNRWGYFWGNISQTHTHTLWNWDVCALTWHWTPVF